MDEIPAALRDQNLNLVASGNTYVPRVLEEVHEG